MHKWIDRLCDPLFQTIVVLNSRPNLWSSVFQPSDLEKVCGQGNSRFKSYWTSKRCLKKHPPVNPPPTDSTFQGPGCVQFNLRQRTALGTSSETPTALTYQPVLAVARVFEDKFPQKLNFSAFQKGCKGLNDFSTHHCPRIINYTVRTVCLQVISRITSFMSANKNIVKAHRLLEIQR